VASSRIGPQPAFVLHQWDWSETSLILDLFTRDRGTTSRCYGECARVWPVTVTRAKPRAGGAAVASKLGTTKRRDGRLQVTYAGRPLYYYVGDSPGVATCHNVSEFGGLWLLLRASGRRV
jgi:predicted lipoprotein with Yx(FWY)xxD motif